MEWFAGHYLADKADGADWRVSPLRAKNLSGVAPAVIATAWFDPLRDEGAAYAKRLTAAGNRAGYVNFARQIHGFLTMGKVIDEANTAVALCAAELKRMLKPAAAI